jgi:UDP-3-O-[3-hydroxymyristoyl] glucosamine N-acyltransferase
MSSPLTAGQIASKLDAEILGDESIPIHGLGTLEHSSDSDIFCITDRKIINKINRYEFAAVVTPKAIKTLQKPQIIYDNPKKAFAFLLEWLFPTNYPERNVSNRASIADTAIVGKNCYIGEFVVIGEHVTIGDGCFIYPNTTIYDYCSIGSNCVIHSNVTIYDHSQIGNRCSIHAGTIIGSDGYGFYQEADQHFKVPQRGNVIIGDDVELGSNCCVDRATVGSTRIGKGSKFDNLVQIGHNVEIGENCLFVAQVGVGGSCILGNNCILAGQAGIADHIKITDRVIIGAQSGLGDNIQKPGSYFLGTPAKDFRLTHRLYGAYEYIPDLLKRVKRLEKLLEQQKGGSDE